MKLLIVDDDREIVELLTIYLKNEKFEIVKAFDGKQALEKINQYPDIDAVILDIMMPKMDGITVVNELRKDGKQIPILLLSAKSTDMDKIQGLTTGADDYVTKPFNPLEVVARIKSLLRRSSITHELSPEELRVGPLIIQKNAHKVMTVDGKEIQLTVLEFGILYLLASHPGRVFSADEIFEKVWNQYSGVSTKTVMVHVSHLRDKIAEVTGRDKVIETVWGVGYKIDA
ncbi:DNA-binding response regulator, OmpR family, contains REC and winged-helix (wHTH) domain [Granulicatella balaenopterae]|uniref:DNA-binding response regulator, OmpR family, contains REC and winged-helix (WHTH) domain n=1 Tax=Granulicatella balaenopterae TaxID=137733 RepID=A0A1H9MA65_9LACT|nr:response regulator transcription factor [Granulicatella balaenopterae]SER20532.1 DNA-binding response regulator, OmpR family, contains REC and winged-helix (wHTH) domain [Granulicatella balaenopterae]